MHVLWPCKIGVKCRILWVVTPSRDDSAPCSLLLIVGSLADAAQLRTHVTTGVLAGAEADHVRRLERALARLEQREYGAILLDLALPDSDGLVTFAAISEAAPRSAIVVLTEPGQEWLADEVVRRGAQGCLIKGDRRTGDIAPTVLHAVRRQRVLNELNAARTEQLAQKDRFLSHVSHELRSPLAVVYQFASLLADGVEGPLNEQQSEYTEVIMRNANQLKVMIDDLLQVSHAKRDKVVIEREFFSLGELVSEAVADFRPAADKREIAIAYQDAVLPDVIADPSRVRQIIGNLIGNALKFTAVGGRIDIEADAEADAVRITVRDTGIGMPREDLPYIFEQFYQGEQSDRVSRHGLGLGLYVCRDLVIRQGGRIEADSEPGRGTAISFTLPTQRLHALTEVSA
jgi:signal transduction histidine kinase